MTVYSKTDGKRETAIASLSDTNEVDLIVSSENQASTLESITFCNTSSGSLNVDLIYDKGGSTVYVCNQEPVAAHSRLHIKDHNVTIDAGSVLRVRSSGAGIDVSAVHVRTHAGIKG